MTQRLFTSESVSEGHPDKMADQISDAILDAIISEDSSARVAAETMVTTGMAVVAGEITTSCYVDIPEIVRKTVKEIGYDSSSMGYDYQTCAVLTSIDRQSPDIAMGVKTTGSEDQGAGDQGLMFGYAVNETPELMPLSISLSHQLVYNLAQLRKSKKLNFLRPDSKSQVTVEYDGETIKRIDSIVISTQHSEDVTGEQIKEAVVEELIKKTVPAQYIDSKTKFLVNPTGRFVIGGPLGDCGLTGRKIIVDTYGGHGAHGGGAFSGKDPSKVDRSAAYASRHIAKNIVASGLAKRCLVQLAYAIGVADPVSVMIEDYGTSSCGSHKLEKAVKEIWNLKPSSIIQKFDLLRPIYQKTAAYGHFGRSDSDFTWEKTNKVDDLKDLIKKM